MFAWSPLCFCLFNFFEMFFFLASDSFLTVAADFLRFNLLRDGACPFLGVPLVPLVSVSVALTVGCLWCE